MSRITIAVVNPSETEKTTITVPDDVAVGDLTAAIVKELGLPQRGSNGRRLRYHVNLSDEEGNLEQLDESESLDENEVDDGSVLQLTVEMSAG